MSAPQLAHIRAKPAIDESMPYDGGDEHGGEDDTAPTAESPHRHIIAIDYRRILCTASFNASTLSVLSHV